MSFVSCSMQEIKTYPQWNLLSNDQGLEIYTEQKQSENIFLSPVQKLFLYILG